MSVAIKNYGEDAKVIGVGATLASGSAYCYLGDGDGYSYATATILTAAGEIATVAAGGASAIKVDASDEVIAAAVVAREAAALASRAKDARTNAAVALRRVGEVEKGRTVKIAKKRAKNSGAEGVVFWMGECRFGRRVTDRIGFKVEGQAEPVWTAASNVVVTDGNEDAAFAAFAAEAVALAAETAASDALARAAADASAALAVAAFRLAVAAAA